MNVQIQISVTVIILLAVFALFSLIRKAKLQLKYALMWLFTAAMLLFITWVPQVVYALGCLMGVEYPVNAVFFLGFCFVLVLIFFLTMLVSNMSLQLKTLTQRIGLLEKRVRELEKKEDKIDEKERETDIH
ncbi:MAG: DUF2304 domain-containing protein [Lachnospiraceae bacterium]|jgi:hypothetical protein